MKKIRVLVTGGSQIGKAGVASIVYKWGTSFSGEVVYDYLMQRGLPDQIYVDNIRNKGSRIFTMDNRSHSMLSIIFWVKNIVKKYIIYILNGCCFFILILISALFLRKNLSTKKL